jgi:hypothetical protein
VDVPIQFFQSVIAIEVAITGALLFQVRFFESAGSAEAKHAEIAAPGLRVAMAVVLGATVFGSLYAIAIHGQRTAAMAVTVGLALSLLPILLRVLPPVTSPRSDIALTSGALALYFVAVATMVVFLGR